MTIQFTMKKKPAAEAAPVQEVVVQDKVSTTPVPPAATNANFKRPSWSKDPVATIIVSTKDENDKRMTIWRADLYSAAGGKMTGKFRNMDTLDTFPVTRVIFCSETSVLKKTTTYAILLQKSSVEDERIRAENIKANEGKGFRNRIPLPKMSSEPEPFCELKPAEEGRPFLFSGKADIPFLNEEGKPEICEADVTIFRFDKEKANKYRISKGWNPL